MSSGATDSAEIVRLGETVAVTEISREVRPTLEQAASLQVRLPSRVGCTLLVGHATVAADFDAVFHAALVTRAGEREDVYEGRSSSRQPGWTDAQVSLSSLDGHTLELTVAGKGAAGAFWSRPLLSCAAKKKRNPLRNVLLLSLDTLRADRLTAYGNTHAITPHLDGVAAAGTTFAHAYSHFPNTLGSHGSIFTGRYPSQHGLMTGGGKTLKDDTETLAAAFANNGYFTAAFTENAFVSSNFGFGVGFDRYHNGPLGEGDGRFPGEVEKTFARGIEWLENRPTAPFFLFLHTYEVHTPYTPDERTLARLMEARDAKYTGQFSTQLGGLSELAYNAGKMPLSASDIAQIERLYDAEVVKLDKQVGLLLAELKRLGLRESTLIVLLSDHGDEFNEHGHLGHGESLYDEVLHVPLVFHLPGVVPKGRKIRTRVGLIDVGPTVAELAGIGAPFSAGPARSHAAEVLGTGLESRPGPVFSELDASITACKDAGRGGFKTCPLDAVSIRDDSYTYFHFGTDDEELLFRFPGDIHEQKDIAVQFPEVSSRYRKMATDFRLRASQDGLDTSKAELDPGTREKLRALGYIE